jgi:N-acetylglucosaminyl-diphospho-decaprenol L-rhamnosyltransferase
MEWESVAMLSVVIVNWNSGQLLRHCVRSLREHAGDCRILVVDNASDDGSLEAAAEATADVTVIRNDSNRGFAAACNQGWRAADCAHILFLNPDTECLAGSVAALEQTLDTDRTVWAVGGCLIEPDGSPQTDFNVRPFPTVGRVAAEMFFIDELLHLFHGNRAREAPSRDRAVDVEQPAAACLIVRRTALELVGGFDESFYPAWFEDVDLCLRLRKKGGRIQFQPEAGFLHHGGYSLNRMSNVDFLTHFHRNQIRYFRKHRGLPAALHVQKMIILGLLLRAAVSLLYPLARGASRAGSAGIFWKSLCNIAKSGESWK